jgi:penicillin amidase
VALAWTALEPSNTADAILEMNRAHDWDSFRAAAESFAVPAQNLVYADRAGHIGYQAPGRIPVRAPGHDGTMPVEGWDSANDWTGELVPFEALPSVLDPEEGFIVTANQAVAGDDYPYDLGADVDQGYRSQRIRELIEAGESFDVAAMTRIQLDTRHPAAPALVPRLLDVDLEGSWATDGQRLLAGWDFDQDADSAAAAWFNVVWSNVLALTFHDELHRGAWPDGSSRWVRVVSELLDQPRSRWWDDVETPAVETRDDVLRTAMEQAREELTRLRSADPEAWSWGRLHRMDLQHPAFGELGLAPLRRLFNSGGWQVGGGSSAVDATGWDPAEGYGVVTAPSMRMVVSTDDWDDSVWVDLTGVSGHPMSAHYSDQTELWVRGEYLPWAYSTDAVAGAAEDTLTLVPQTGGSHAPD